MFHDISQPMLDRMAYLEAVDERDRQDGTPKSRRLRQIPPETGRLLAILAASAPPGQLLEVGTSGGYSGMWLSLACQQRGDVLVTFDVDTNKMERAKETFRLAGVDDWVRPQLGDARQYLSRYSQVAFCFMDAEKDIYASCYDLVVPNLVPGGLFVADNVISHGEELASFCSQALSDRRVDALVVPIGKGLLVCRKV